MATLETVQGSYRDPSGHVFSHEGRIFRTITQHGYDAFKAVEETGFLTDLVEHQCSQEYILAGGIAIDHPGGSWRVSQGTKLGLPWQGDQRILLRTGSSGPGWPRI